MNTPISVIIPTIGRLSMLTECIGSIAKNTALPAEILISIQDTVADAESLTSKFPKLPIRIEKCEGVGIARNMNFALEKAKHDQVLVTHDDCTVATDWISEGFRLLNQFPDAIVTGRVLPGGDNPKLVPSTITLDKAINYTGTLAHGVLYPNNMVVNRKAILNAGGFDQRSGFLTAAEDLDFSYRWLTSGKVLRYEPSLVVTHNDWRSPAQLTKLYKHYARCAGRYYGKYLYQGDTRPAKQGVRDIVTGLKAWKDKLKLNTPRYQDERLELPIWVPVGLVEGLLESRRLDKKKV